MKFDYAAYRGEWLKWLKKQLQGPPEKQSQEQENPCLVGVSPLERYPVAVLYPVIAGEGIDVAEDEFMDDSHEGEAVSLGVTDNTKEEATATRTKRYTPPSSVGFSFFVSSNKWSIQVRFSAVCYKENNLRDEQSGQFKKIVYERVSLGGDEQALNLNRAGRFNVMPETPNGTDYRAAIDVRSRSHKNGTLLTVSMINTRHVDTALKAEDFRRQEIECALFETALYCWIEEGEVGDYPGVAYSLLDEEQQELELQYQHKKIYAVGHGAAVDWQLNEAGKVQRILTDFLPQVEVPQMTADVLRKDSPVLNMAFLQQCRQEPNHVLSELESFVDGYGQWIAGQHNTPLNASQQSAAGRILQRMQTAMKRMQGGINTLRHNELARKAFTYANQVMLAQMQQADKCAGRSRAVSEYCWRPFQLAFILTALQSSIDKDDAFRDTVDLIWFPTGGGKTEAYLGLIAFVIAWRRLRYQQSGSGTAAFMRYTLRLLTTQQYLRACRMICAFELLRQQNSHELGEETITIGLWVGSDTSPNSYVKACEIIENHRHGSNSSLAAFVLERCPWCDTQFAANRNYCASRQSFHFICTGKSCEFSRSQQKLPCNVVDDALYDSPPTLLLATIDKFARLLWEPRAGAFFGVGNNHLPPELIIQDELHLISSALGSVAGVYEAGIESILEAKGIYPKYIASTATIRMAKEQIRALYAKDVAVFPPPGLSANDSFFSKTVPTTERPGRLYVGYFASRLSRQRSLAPLAAAVLSAPELVFDKKHINSDVLREAWWTQLIYHGSLRGVGNTQNIFSMEARNFYQRLLDEAFQNTVPQNFASELEKQKKLQAWLLEQEISARFEQEPALLTSQSSAGQNAQTFSALERSRGETGCIDAVLATNMVSVGLDVSRLAVMIVNGQPLTTAEYIQASSRVGRAAVPGIVFVNYYRDQTRSLSHYENFRPYHESFYRYVEPSSVTPYTYQTRRRALHAALVLALRYSVPAIFNNEKAGNFDIENPEIMRVVDLFVRRCVRADPSREKEIRAHIQDLLVAWETQVKLSQTRKVRLYYQKPANERNADRLLYNYGDDVFGLWPTLQSMRNVESTGLLKGS